MVDNFRSYPFPFGMKGAYYELNEGDRVRFFEIFYIQYSPDEVERLTKIDCLEDSNLGKYLKNIDPRLISDSTFFLYNIHTY